MHASRVPATRIIARTEGTGHTHHRTHRGYRPHASSHAPRVLAARIEAPIARIAARIEGAGRMLACVHVEGTGRMHHRMLHDTDRMRRGYRPYACIEGAGRMHHHMLHDTDRMRRGYRPHACIACVEGTDRTLASHASRVPAARLHRMRRGYRPHACIACVEGTGRMHHACTHRRMHREYRPRASRVPAARIMHASRVLTARR
jgi:hypothetical protein